MRVEPHRIYSRTGTFVTILAPVADEPAPDTPRNPLPKPKEPERKDEREIEDPREKRWL